MSENKKPILIYDGDCGFCNRWIERCKFITGEKVDYSPYQLVRESFPEISEAEFIRSVQYIGKDGNRSQGAEAIFRLLAQHPNQGWLLRVYLEMPRFRKVAENFYQTVAKNREILSKITHILAGPPMGRPTLILTRDIFLRGFGLIYAVAFASLMTQILGLVGSEGILPAKIFLTTVSQNVGIERYWQYPTLFWLEFGDESLRLVCLIGMAIGTAVALGIYAGFALFLLWTFYLSLTVVCQDFLAFQWDNLLLETGFLAIFLAPNFWSKKKSREEPSFLVIILFRLLLFKLMFSAGVVKIISNDPLWHNLKALEYYYETQPLPTWIGWYAHHFPEWIQLLSTAFVFFVELFLPYLIIGPRRFRILYFWLNLGLQFLISLTGNFGFFNLLTMLLCLFLLDDNFLAYRFSPVASKAKEIRCSHLRGFRKGTTIACTTLLIYLNFFQLLFLFKSPSLIPGFLMTPLVWAQPFRLVNRYGLFAVITIFRPEVIVEGSNDLKIWKAYGFKWKVGEMNESPKFVAPHQPRLDWQMWFAALEHYKANSWFINFMDRLTEGSQDVLGLLNKNPFPESPPKFIRAILYDYRFTDVEERRRTGAWWKRKRLIEYTPILNQRQKKPQKNSGDLMNFER